MFKNLIVYRLTAPWPVGLGEVEAVLVERQPVADKKDQVLEVWLAPQHEWYPVKLRYADGDKEQVEQTLRTVTKP